MNIKSAITIAVSQPDSNRDHGGAELRGGRVSRATPAHGADTAIGARSRAARVMTAQPPLALITPQSRTAGRNGFVFAKIMIVDCRPPSKKIGFECA